QRRRLLRLRATVTCGAVHLARHALFFLDRWRREGGLVQVDALGLLQFLDRFQGLVLGGQRAFRRDRAQRFFGIPHRDQRAPQHLLGAFVVHRRVLGFVV